MRKILVLLALLFTIPAYAVTPPAAVSAPGLNPSANLGDLQSQATTRTNTLPVTKRAPTSTDILNYQAGVSLWIDPQNQAYQLVDITNGAANWSPFGSFGTDPCALVSATSFCGGTRRELPTYTGPVFDATRATDLSSLTVNLVGANADISSLCGFLAPANGIGYATKFYDQNAAGNHATQTVLAMAPQIDCSTISGNNVALRFNHTERAYYLGLHSFTTTWPGSSGTTVMLTNLASFPVSAPWILPGDLVNGTNIPTNDVLVSIDYTTGAIVLTTAPTGTPGNVTFSNPATFMDLPNTMQVPWQTYSVIETVQHSAMGDFAEKPFIFGVHGLDAANAAGSWSGVILPGPAVPYGFRLFDGNNVSGSTVYGGNWSTYPQVVAYSLNGRNLTYQFEGQQASITNARATTPTATLSGGALGYSNQFAGTIAANTGGDFLYDFFVSPTSITASTMNQVTLSVSQARGLKPQVVTASPGDGSSTTGGNGTTPQESWPGQIALRSTDINPTRSYNVASGGPIETSVANFPGFAGNMPATQKGIIAFHPGMGNSMQISGTFTATATNQSTGVITLSASTANTSAAPGVHVSAPANLPAGAFLIAGGVTSSVQIDPAHLPTGNLASITLLPDTGSQAYASIQAYCTAAAASGYKGVMLIGSASRGPFTAPQLVEFGTLKVLARENWRTMCATTATFRGIVGYYDYETDPAFGDGGAMVVTSHTSNTIVVQTPNAYAISGSRIYWPGMPNSIANDTGNQTITNATGNVLTVSGLTTGVVDGQTVTSINPTPWTTYPQFWNTDNQHFPPAAYQRQGGNILQYQISNGLLFHRGLDVASNDNYRPAANDNLTSPRFRSTAESFAAAAP